MQFCKVYQKMLFPLLTSALLHAVSDSQLCYTVWCVGCVVCLLNMIQTAKQYRNGLRQVSCVSSSVHDLQMLKGVAEGQSLVMRGHVLWFVLPCLYFSSMLALNLDNFLDKKIIVLASGTATPLTNYKNN